MGRRLDLEADPVFVGMRSALSASYSTTLRTTDLTPLQALEYMALALGSLYRDIAEAHIEPGGCNCGWQPSEILDLIALQQSLAVTAGAEDEITDMVDLSAMTPLGHG